MNELDLAWLAGFFDGEGNIRIAKKHSVSLTISQKEREALDKVVSILGAGTIYYRDILTPGGKATHTHIYYLGGRNAVEALKYLVPFLVVKQAKAQEAIDLNKDCREWGQPVLITHA